MEAVDPVTVVYADRRDDEDAKIFGRNDPVMRVTDVSAERLAENVARLSRTMDAVFDRISAADGPYELDSFEVYAELTGSGEVRLVGAVSMAVTGGLRLTFKKREAAATS
ncbi:hypothetical protein [Nocardioides speluncae]|uniref:Pepco domain-containing protein n=1 Tax=Nocardioides speluncae TaxID=2670337 RepID=UPI0012B1664F|nr:hypothetical protein [Nocardioides speluncae]